MGPGRLEMENHISGKEGGNLPFSMPVVDL